MNGDCTYKHKGQWINSNEYKKVGVRSANRRLGTICVVSFDIEDIVLKGSNTKQYTGGVSTRCVAS